MARRRSNSSPATLAKKSSVKRKSGSPTTTRPRSNSKTIKRKAPGRLSRQMLLSRLKNRINNCRYSK